MLLLLCFLLMPLSPNFVVITDVCVTDHHLELGMGKMESNNTSDERA
jgi:hypothetical protein